MSRPLLASGLLWLAFFGCDDTAQDPDPPAGDGALGDLAAPEAGLAPDRGPARDALPADAGPQADAAFELDAAFEPDAAPDALPLPDAAPETDATPDAAPPAVCGDGILGPGEACDGEPACVDCAWPPCDALGTCPGPVLLPPGPAGQFGRPRRSGPHLVASNPSAEHSGSRSAGEVFAYRDEAGELTRTQTLRAGDPSRDASFGQHLALAGDTLAVGEPGRQRVHLYRWDGERWAPDGRIGSGPIAALALAGDRLAVGDRNAGREAGAVRIFERGAEGWAEAPALAPEGLAQGDRFGSAVALAGDQLLVGAPGAAAGAGAVHLFARTPEGWSAAPALSLPIEGLGLGRVLALDEDAGIIGCEAFDGGRGAVVFLRRDPDGWALEEPRSPPQIRLGDRLGTAVALAGDRAVVQARGPGGGGPDAATGRILVFDRGPAGWALSGELRHPGRGALGGSLDLEQGVISAGLSAWWGRFDNGVSTYTGAVATYR